LECGDVAAEWDEIAELYVPRASGHERFRLERTETVLGSDPSCDVVVPELHGRHGRIVRRMGGYALDTLDETPIELNWNQVALVPLAHNDRIGLDDFTMGFYWGMPPASAWPSLTTSQPMLDLLSSGAEADPPSPRKYRLFLAACSRRFGTPREPRLVDALERWADGQPGEPPPSPLRNDDECWRHAADQARLAVTLACWPTTARPPEAEHWRLYDAAELVMCRLIREVFGNPFRDGVVPDALRRWQSGTPARLAKTAYAERLADGALDPALLSVLADALLDAGCDDDSLLEHLREPGPHFRGCWAVDAVLGWS
jgi:hypothetical protein